MKTENWHLTMTPGEMLLKGWPLWVGLFIVAKLGVPGFSWKK